MAFISRSPSGASQVIHVPTVEIVSCVMGYWPPSRSAAEVLGQSISATAQGLVWVYWGDFWFQIPAVQQLELAAFIHSLPLLSYRVKIYHTEMPPSPWELVVRGNCLKSLTAWMPCGFTQRKARVFCNCNVVWDVILKCTPFTPISCLPQGRYVLVLER